MNKKGLSTVVVTILIVLVAIIAVAILWAALRPQIKGSAERAGTNSQCFSIGLSIKSAVYSNPNLNVTVMREAGAADKFTTLRILVDGSVKLTTAAMSELETKTYIINVGATKPTQNVQVAALLEGNVSCDVADTLDASDIS